MGAKSSNQQSLVDLSAGINISMQQKSVLQYQINQLKAIVQAKKAFPDITEVKESLLTNITLGKDIKDTENLLNSIKGSADESVASLEEIYLRLTGEIEMYENRSKLLEEEVLTEASSLAFHQAKLAKLTEENESLQSELETFRRSERYKAIEVYENSLGNTTFNGINFLTPQGNFLDKNTRREIMRSRQEVFIEINNELQRINEEEKKVMQIIQEAEMKKQSIEKSRNEIELKKSFYPMRSLSETPNSIIEVPFSVKAAAEQERILERSQFLSPDL